MRAEMKEAPFPAISPRAEYHTLETSLGCKITQTERYTKSMRLEETHDDGLLCDWGKVLTGLWRLPRVW